PRHRFASRHGTSDASAGSATHHGSPLSSQKIASPSTHGLHDGNGPFLVRPNRWGDEGGCVPVEAGGPGLPRIRVHFGEKTLRVSNFPAQLSLWHCPCGCQGNPKDCPPCRRRLRCSASFAPLSYL